MKVLMIYGYYEPEIAASMYLFSNLTEALAERGHDVLIYTPVPTRGIPDSLRKQYLRRRKEIQFGGRVKIRRFWLPKEKKSILSRGIRYILLNLSTLFKGMSTCADVIFMNSTPPTNMLVGVLLCKLKKSPVIYNIQDMFPESLAATGIVPQNSVLYKIANWMAELSYRRLSGIITISDQFKNRLLEMGVDYDKIRVVPNWVDESAVYKKEREQNYLLKKYQLNKEDFFITYSGNIGYTQNIDMLLTVAKELEDYPDMKFVLIGDGAYKKEAVYSIKQKNIRNVIVLPFQDYQYISDVFSLGDIGIVISKQGVQGSSVPSKTWSIMAAECPVLASFDLSSELCKMIDGNNCGICVDAGDKEQFKDAILWMYEHPEERKVLGENGRRYILEHLTKEIGTEQYIDVLEMEGVNKKF